MGWGTFAAIAAPLALGALTGGGGGGGKSAGYAPKPINPEVLNRVNELWELAGGDDSRQTIGFGGNTFQRYRPEVSQELAAKMKLVSALNSSAGTAGATAAQPSAWQQAAGALPYLAPLLNTTTTPQVQGGAGAMPSSGGNYWSGWGGSIV